MGKTAEDVMKKAISFIGTKESPANSNNVIFNTHYYGREVRGSAYPWCMAYVWDIFRLAGASDLFYDGKKTAYCPTLESWGKSKKLTVDKSKGEYGDIVLFDFSGKGVSGHVGFIVQRNSDGTYKTVEGNTAVGNDANGGCVMYRTRNKSTIRCIIRPKYDEGSFEKKTHETTTTIADFEDLTKNVVFYEKGDEGAKVKDLQTWLISLGYDLGKYGADGDFGNATEKAIIEFQKDYGIEPTGKYDRITNSKVQVLIKTPFKAKALKDTYIRNGAGDGYKAVGVVPKDRVVSIFEVKKDYGKGVAGWAKMNDFKGVK